MQIYHVRLLVTHFAECFRFYRDVLGFSVSWGVETGTYASFVGSNKGEDNLAIFGRKSMAEAIGTADLPVDATAQDKSMLIIRVEDVDAEAARLAGLGVKIINGPLDHPGWGMRTAYLRDPDGNLIELMGGLPEDQWTTGLLEASRLYSHK